MKLLTVCSARAAATLTAITSSRGQRTCEGFGFASGGFFLEVPRGVVAAAGLREAEGKSSAGVRMVGLAIGAYFPYLFHACMLKCVHASMKPCLYVLPESGRFNRGWPFRCNFEGRAAVSHGGGIRHAVADKGFRHGAVMGKRSGGLCSDTGVRLCLVQDEQERDLLTLQKLNSGGSGPQVRRAGTDRNQHQVGQVKEHGCFIGAARRGVNEAKGRIALPQLPQAFTYAVEGQFNTLREFRLSFPMPRCQGALRVGVYKEDRTIARAFRFNGEVSAKRGLPASPFLRIDDDSQHGIMPSCLHALM